ncbi:AAA family ATPase [Allokutzneria sp. A3M-2-11 16]|uniref:helix-turn-helix transcriptional regulator n=1 Tax=Allokutzneria sp. A3M-2-11 16 TaxID=2962043 RepID=UPI0020B8A89F|nr:LuxR family transcriptional regulator [Allokutzneria sp. A3M-2-11 16]MCP3802446.1 AAA family ATPase [Allokutzneria sp. A3M-2-11 16]
MQKRVGGAVRPLVGREAEQDALTRAISRLAEGQGGGLFLSGDPGIGKSRLLTDLTWRASMRGLTVFSGRSAEFERDLPFGVFVDALDDYLADLQPGELEALGRAHVAQLAAVFPSLADHASDQGQEASSPSVRFRIYRAMRELLDVLAKDTSLVLALDDLHWADRASIELMEHLLRHPPRGRVLIAAAYRPRQLAPQLSTALLLANTQWYFEVVEVAPLTLAETADLLELGADDPRLTDLFEASRGNPFYAEALSEVATEARYLPGVFTEGSAPPAVLAALRSELYRLSAVVRRAAGAAAVLGDPFTPDLVAEVAELDLPTAVAALDELVRQDVIRVSAGGSQFGFRHPLVRSVTYGDTESVWRFAAHRRAADALRARRSPVLLYAHHLERSAQPGDHDAASVLSSAARSVLSTAPDTAASWLQTALRLLPTGEPYDAQRIELLSNLATAFSAIGKTGRSRDLMHEVLDLLPKDSDQRLDIVLRLSKVERGLGRANEARALVLRELENAGERNRSGRAGALLEIAIINLAEGDVPEACHWAEDALTLSSGPGLVDRLNSAVAAAMIMATAPGGDASARLTERVLDATPAIDAASDEELSTYFSLVVSAITTVMWVERMDDSVRQFIRAMNLARQSTHRDSIMAVILASAEAHMWQGALEASETAAEDALEAAMLTDNQEQRLIAWSTLCAVSMWRGDVEEALRFGRLALGGEDPATSGRSRSAGYYSAAALLLKGEPAEARRWMMAAIGDESMASVAVLMRPPVLEILVRIELALGDVGAAETWARRIDPQIGEVLPGRWGMRHLAHAQVLIARDRFEEAARLGREGAELCASVGMRLYEGRCRLVAGMALGELGRHDEARVEFGAAKDLFAARGAKRLHEDVISAQRQLGAKMPRRRGAGDGLLALTSREREVAELISQGRTNKQVAEHLFVSPKTVEAHLSRIFNKLNVSSRSGLTAVVFAARETKD